VFPIPRVFPLSMWLNELADLTQATAWEPVLAVALEK